MTVIYTNSQLQIDSLSQTYRKMKINFCTSAVTDRDGLNVVALLGITDESQRAIILALVWRQGPRSGKMDTRRRLSKCHSGQIYSDKICPPFHIREAERARFGDRLCCAHADFQSSGCGCTPDQSRCPQRKCLESFLHPPWLAVRRKQ